MVRRRRSGPLPRRHRLRHGRAPGHRPGAGLAAPRDGPAPAARLLRHDALGPTGDGHRHQRTASGGHAHLPRVRRLHLRHPLHGDAARLSRRARRGSVDAQRSGVAAHDRTTPAGRCRRAPGGCSGRRSAGPRRWRRDRRPWPGRSNPTWPGRGGQPARGRGARRSRPRGLPPGHRLGPARRRIAFAVGPHLVVRGPRRASLRPRPPRGPGARPDLAEPGQPASLRGRGPRRSTGTAEGSNREQAMGLVRAGGPSRVDRASRHRQRAVATCRPVAHLHPRRRAGHERDARRSRPGVQSGRGRPSALASRRRRQGRLGPGRPGQWPHRGRARPGRRAIG